MTIGGHTRTLGLIGNPVEHTMSPVLQNFLADRLGVNVCYVPFHVKDGFLEAAVKGAYGLNILGLNVTVPYKSDVMEYLVDVDDMAKRIGAVNTLVRVEGGYKGYNTDMPGLYRAMCHDGVDITGKEVVILGAGGVARAVAMLLLEKGAGGVIIFNRSVERAKAIADEVNTQAGREFIKAYALSSYKEVLGEKRYIVVQATSVGMLPNTENAVVEEEEFYRHVEVGYDLIFNPPVTRFMKLCDAAGARSYNGAKMLAYQGIIAFELWNNLQVGEDEAKECVEHLLEKIGNGGK